MPASTMHTLADNFGSHLASSGSHAIPEQDKPKAVLTTRHVSRLRSSEDHETQQTASLASGLSDAQAVLRCTKRLSMALLTGIAAAGFVDERFLPDLSLRVRHISHNVQRLKRNTEFLRSAAGNKLFQCLRQEIEQVKCLWIKYDALQTAYVECDKQELTKATEPHQGGHKEAYEAFVINKYVEGAHLPGDRIWEAGDLPFPSICYDTTIWPTWHRLREAGRADRSQVFESGKVIFPRAVYTILEHWRKDVKSVLQSVLQIQNTQGVRDMEAVSNDTYYIKDRKENMITLRIDPLMVPESKAVSSRGLRYHDRGRVAAAALLAQLNRGRRSFKLITAVNGKTFNFTLQTYELASDGEDLRENGLKLLFEELKKPLEL